MGNVVEESSMSASKTHLCPPALPDPTLLKHCPIAS